MYEIVNAQPITIAIIVGSIMITPVYILATYVFSDASRIKGAQIGAGFVLFGATMFLVCVSGTPGKIGLLGQLIVPMAWILPSLTLYIFRDWFLSQPLSQKWLIGLQLLRVIGALFLLEMLSGNVPAVFAYPAGLGDVLVALVALSVLIKFRGQSDVSSGAIALVVLLGALDFVSAFFFGFTSAETSAQLFFPSTPSKLIQFPTGMIPLFLVPYAIFFHTLSVLNYRRFDALRHQREASDY